MISFNILLVEDDDNLRDALTGTLTLAGFNWVEASSAEQALVLLQKEKIDLVVSDVQMAGMNGLTLLRNINRLYPDLPMLLMTAFANIEDAVFAMKEGAIDYIAKPFASEVLVNMINRYLPKITTHSNVIACDSKSLTLLSLAKKIAKTDANVLVLGASGTGKEVLAGFIHQHSPRAAKPFVALNCAAIPENMLEATLFGYEKGAFTGAIQACPGKFEQAQEGTILLDEISEMALSLQAKLLRVLQEREVERLGSRKSIKLDVRVIATSNRDLAEYVKQGQFREDLYYRLNVFPLAWASLSERIDDIIPLAQYFLAKHSAKHRRAPPKMDESCLQKLISYAWPGNVRELDNVMQRALILCQQESIDANAILLEGMDWQNADSLQQLIDKKPPSLTSTSFSIKDNCEQKQGLDGELKVQEFSIILTALKDCNGKRKEVAERLGISARTLRYKLARMREAGIDIPS